MTDPFCCGLISSNEILWKIPDRPLPHLPSPTHVTSHPSLSPVFTNTFLATFNNTTFPLFHMITQNTFTHMPPPKMTYETNTQIRMHVRRTLFSVRCRFSFRSVLISPAWHADPISFCSSHSFVISSMQPIASAVVLLYFVVRSS